MMRRPARWVLVHVTLACLLLFPAGGSVAHGAGAASGSRPLRCDPGAHPERGLQGRVSAEDIEGGYASDPIRCNARLVGRFGSKGIYGGSAGGFKVLRYVDSASRECAYYDSTILFPMSAQKVGHEGLGVYVMDMSNPARPVKTANLLTPAMQSPHESMSLNARRGLLVAVSNFSLNPGILDVYDVTRDCRHPRLLSSTPLGVLGHEGNFSPDGRTYWTSSGGGFVPDGTLVAVDLSNPSVPSVVWASAQYRFHGVSLSPDGTRLYGSDLGAPPVGNLHPYGLRILDVSEIQARAPNPAVREVAFLTYEDYSLPQMSIPVTIGGRPYVIAVDEFARGLGAGDPAAPVGAVHIVDVADERHPEIVSKIDLEVHRPEHIATVADDPGARFPEGGYAVHYCAVPRQREPRILACSFILSGLRVFDIRRPHAPREIAYFNAPIPPSNAAEWELNRAAPFNAAYAMSAPSFVPERGEVWYSDVTFGFFNVRLTASALAVWNPSQARTRTRMPSRAARNRQAVSLPVSRLLPARYFCALPETSAVSVQ